MPSTIGKKREQSPHRNPLDESNGGSRVSDVSSCTRFDDRHSGQAKNGGIDVIERRRRCTGQILVEIGVARSHGIA